MLNVVLAAELTLRSTDSPLLALSAIAVGPAGAAARANAGAARTATPTTTDRAPSRRLLRVSSRLTRRSSPAAVGATTGRERGSRAPGVPARGLATPGSSRMA